MGRKRQYATTIEGGWQELEGSGFARAAAPLTKELYRDMFFSGAMHVLSIFVYCKREDREAIMTGIHQEVGQYVDQLKRRIAEQERKRGPTKRARPKLGRGN